MAKSNPGNGAKRKPQQAITGPQSSNKIKKAPQSPAAARRTAAAKTASNAVAPYRGVGYPQKRGK